MDKDLVIDNICELAAGIQRLALAGIEAYRPLVDDIIRSGSRDEQVIERMLDRLLDLCVHENGVELFRCLCRYYYYINPAATADYVLTYRKMWDNDEVPDNAEAEA